MADFICFLKYNYNFLRNDHTHETNTNFKLICLKLFLMNITYIEQLLFFFFFCVGTVTRSRKWPMHRNDSLPLLTN